MNITNIKMVMSRSMIKVPIKNSIEFILENYHQPKRPAALDTEHPKSAVRANKFKMNPGILDFGFPV